MLCICWVGILSRSLAILHIVMLVCRWFNHCFAAELPEPCLERYVMWFRVGNFSSGLYRLVTRCIHRHSIMCYHAIVGENTSFSVWERRIGRYIALINEWATKVYGLVDSHMTYLLFVSKFLVCIIVSPCTVVVNATWSISLCIASGTRL